MLGDESPADVSTWADQIRRERKNTAPLLYANPTPGSAEFGLDRDCPEQGCVVSAILKYSHVLRDKNTTRQDRYDEESGVGGVDCIPEALLI